MAQGDQSASRAFIAALDVEDLVIDDADLERAFAAQDLGFDTRVFDLAMMDYRVVGGRVHRLAGRPSALFVYQQAATRARLLCQMYAGVMDELPATGEVLEHRGIRFQVYRSGGVTAVFWPEGPIICVLELTESKGHGISGTNDVA